MNLDQVRALITHYEALCPEGEGAIPDYPSLRAEVLGKELVRELGLLKEMLQTPEAFKAGLQNRLLERAGDQEHCASFECIPQSPANRMYWEMAMEVFAPQTLGALLAYLSPNTKRVVVADIDEEAIALRAQDNAELTHKLKELQDNLPLKLEEKAFKAEDFPEAPRHARLGELILVEGCLFDVARISQFPLKTSSDLLSALEAQHPKLFVKLLNHNEAMRGLKADVALFRNNAFTPREALVRLCKGLRLGGARMTGKGFASTAAEGALKEFFDYFLALPKALGAEIKALSGGRKSMEQVFREDLDKGHCVETTASDIEGILQANPGNKALNNPPNLSLEARTLLIKKYRKERPCAQNLDFISLEDLPKKELLGVLKKIKPNTAEELITLLINFPPEFYAVLLGGLLDKEGKQSVLTDLGEALTKGFFNPEQKKALAYALGKNHPLAPIHFFTASPGFSDWSFVVDVLSVVPEPHRLEAVKVKNKFGQTVLHSVANNPESLKAILSLVPEKERLEGVKVKNQFGDTVLHLVANNPELLKAILSLYPEEERLEAVKVQDDGGNTVLHHVAKNPESLKTVLSLYPEEERLEAVKVQNKSGDTLLHLAADNPESLKAILSLYPEEERLEAVKAKNKYGETVLHKAADNPESLKAILSLYPEEERLEAVKVKNKYGETVLQKAADNPESFKAILSLYPEEERLEAVKMRDNIGRTVLHGAVDYLESLKAILSLVPEKERLEAVKVRDNMGTTLLHRAANKPESLKTILSLYPEEERLEAVKVRNNMGTTVLHRAANKPESLKALLTLVPEEERILMLKTEVGSGLVCDKLKDTPLELEHSFAPSYIRLHHFLKSQSTGPASFSFFAHPAPTSLMNGFKNAQSFDEVKQVVVDFLSDKGHESLPLAQRLWNLVAPNSEKSIEVLCAQWGMPLGGAKLAGRGF
jgi:ankyrin repeat protein